MMCVAPFCSVKSDSMKNVCTSIVTSGSPRGPCTVACSLWLHGQSAWKPELLPSCSPGVGGGCPEGGWRTADVAATRVWLPAGPNMRSAIPSTRGSTRYRAKSWLKFTKAEWPAT